MKRFERKTLHAVVSIVLALFLATCSITPTLEKTVVPEMSPAAGTYLTDLMVTITCPTEGATIYYTISGATPTTSSLVYTNGIKVNGESMTITAIASAPGYADSDPVSAQYTMTWAEFPQKGDTTYYPFSAPTGIALFEGSILFTDAGMVYQVPDIYGTCCTGGIGLSNVGGIAVGEDADTWIYLTDAGSGRVIRSRQIDGAGAESFGVMGTGDNEFMEPRGITIASYAVYVADSMNNRIVRFPVFTNGYWEVLSGFNNPSGVAVHPSSGNIYVADTGNNRIVMTNGMSPYYTIWETLGESGGDHTFSNPYGIALEPYTGRIYIADTFNNRIVRMDDITGAGWQTYGTVGQGPGKFNLPHGVVVDEAGYVYVADTGNKRIVRFKWP